MAGHTILLNLIGGVALLLWGTQMVQAAILRASATRSAGRSPAPPAAPLRAAGTGAAAAAAMQSATATAMLVDRLRHPRADRAAGGAGADARGRPRHHAGGAGAVGQPRGGDAAAAARRRGAGADGGARRAPPRPAAS